MRKGQKDSCTCSILSYAIRTEFFFLSFENQVFFSKFTSPTKRVINTNKCVVTTIKCVVTTTKCVILFQLRRRAREAFIDRGNLFVLQIHVSNLLCAVLKCGRDILTETSLSLVNVKVWVLSYFHLIFDAVYLHGECTPSFVCPNGTPPLPGQTVWSFLWKLERTRWVFQKNRDCWAENVRGKVVFYCGENVWGNVVFYSE